VTWLLVGFVGLIGLLIGSFLNVVIHRVPAGESVVHPRSRCPGCGSEIAPRDNIPVISWLILRGKCRNCGEPISIRYPLVELGTSAVFVVLALTFGVSAELPAYLYLGAVGVALAMIDFDTQRLPDALTLPSYPVGLVLLGAASLVDGTWSSLGRGLLGMVALFLFYGVLWFIYPAGMGLGDVKLAGVLGLYLAYQSWGVLVVGGFLGFLLGAVVGLVVIAVQRGGRKTKIPFGPFMLAGTLIALVTGARVWDLYLGSLGL
jgi:leader peptidase (prepilin peptidase) / N-methyltransferase